MNYVGKLDQIIDIKREVRVSDGMGGYTYTLDDVYSQIWAEVSPMSGREVKQHEKLNAEMVNKFVIRYRDDILEDDRIIWGGVEYNIRSIPKAGGRKLYTEIFAERGVGQ